MFCGSFRFSRERGAVHMAFVARDTGGGGKSCSLFCSTIFSLAGILLRIVPSVIDFRNVLTY